MDENEKQENGKSESSANHIRSQKKLQNLQMQIMRIQLKII